ncbi:EF-hand calcium-binding domain-containing protein 8 [Arvicola amphibius]|uniref:EF-hand calcium-binding domain-containing protein 8 n=1 Tax=Arvicola amphibius TaxID=1047088 RepID=UPI001C09644E|nr:EF-hand calcium-binding domain-containing protein 8 [Arvicola amphibius]
MSLWGPFSAKPPSLGTEPIDFICARSRLMSSEKLRKSPKPQKLASPDESQDKETSDILPLTNSLSQNSEIHQRTQQFTEMHLADLQKLFEKETDETGALNKEGFIRIMKKMLSSMSEEMLEVLFLKVDSDCNGFVTWQKYVDYMMREFQGKEEMRKSQYRLRFHLPMTVIPLHHGSEIVKVAFMVQRFKKMGCFITVTKDGILQFWSETFSIMNSFRLSQIQQSFHQKMWVVDMIYMYNLNLIAVASTELKIEFFDISNHKCVQAFTFIDLDSCVMVMDYWSDFHKGVFCYGDTKGNVVIFMSDNVAGGLFNPHILPRTSKWENRIHISLRKLLNEKSPQFRSFRMKSLHPNWCQQVRFIPQLNVVVSCSATERSSLVLTILPAKDPEKPRLSTLNLKKGILCFDYCPDRNFLATGGYDPHIRLWNPLVSKKPVWLMKGHQTSVTHLLVNSKNSSILISISRDKNIRVWDLQDYVCLQSFCGKLFSLGNCPITSAYFHRDRSLICTTYNIGILRGYLESQGPMKTGKMATHKSGLCAVLYSKIFKQVVSGCLQGTVSVWDITTGKKRMEFTVSTAQHSELTAMSLDESERCLLTGLRDGTIQMWNYNTGECLLTFPTDNKVEISGIVHMNKAFYVTGWSKRITNFTFQKTKLVLSCYHWQTYHTEDVLSMAKYQNQLLGTASYNGDILLWNVSMMKPILNFNASESPLPLQPKKVKDTEECIDNTQISPVSNEQKWAHKPPTKFAGFTVRRRLMSAPPVMKRRRDMDQEKNMSQQKSSSAQKSKVSNTLHNKSLVHKLLHNDSQKEKEEFWKKRLLHPNVSVEKWPLLSQAHSLVQIIFLQTRPRLQHTAAMLSSCTDGFIYAWSIHGNGGLLGKFPVDIEVNGSIVVGAMATDENDWILITGDSTGMIKIWDIKEYCLFVGQRPLQPNGSKISTEAENKFRFLIPKQLQALSQHYIPEKEKEVVDGQAISLVPPPLLITWSSHLESVTDILYVDIFQLVVSAGLDGDVKAWKLSGDTIGTFGLNIWKRLQEATMVDGLEQAATSEEKPDSAGTTLQRSFLELHKELAQALVYQRRVQAALMAFLHGKEEKEAEARTQLQQMSRKAPWTKEHSVDDIEESWNQWVKDKQASKIVGAAYKPKEHVRNPKLLATRVQYSWMRQQISPQIYQSLCFTDLKPIQQPDFLMHKVLDQQGRHIRWVASDIRSELESIRGQIFMDLAASSTPAATPSSLSMLSLGASASRVLDSYWSTSVRPLSSVSLLRPWSASPGQSSSSTSPQALSLPRKGQKLPCQGFPASCSIRSLGEPPSYFL